jgi:hypothetical protein
MKQYPTIERLRELFTYDPATGRITVLVHQHKSKLWPGDEAGWIRRSKSNQYRMILVDGVEIFAHRIAWAMHHDAWPEGYVDHVNHDGLDNRIENLREVSAALNSRNQPGQGVQLGVREGYRGAFTAHVSINNKFIHLGTYGTEAEAAAARRGAEIVAGFHPNHGRTPRGR